jgi:hypothetical protein
MFVLAQVAVTTLLIAMPGRLIIQPEGAVRNDHVIGWLWEISLLSLSQQLAFALNFPLIIPVARLLYLGVGGRLTDICFLLCVLFFWARFVPRLARSQEGSQRAKVALLVVLVILAAALARAGVLRFHYPLLYYAGVVWFVVTTILIVIQVRRVVKGIRRSPPVNTKS